MIRDRLGPLSPEAKHQVLAAGRDGVLRPIVTAAGARWRPSRTAASSVYLPNDRSAIWPKLHYTTPDLGQVVRLDEKVGYGGGQLAAFLSGLPS
jgi:hypothetical protein